jgi:dTDP-4-amino-4,6-dideoxyglucose
MEPYASNRPIPDLPNTDRVAARVMALPTGDAVTPDDVSRVASILRAILDQGPAIRGRLGSKTG